MPGRLIVCPTPIGNMDDITKRVRDALVTANYIACEDTRRTGRLLDRLEIRPKPRLVSNHEGNEISRAEELTKRIERGERVALVSDAGMPAISDPGYRLVHACIERGLEIDVLPGPSVVPVALVASGLPTDRWRFEGFLPKRSGEMERVLRSTETVIAFESPRRIGASLAASACPNWPCVTSPSRRARSSWSSDRPRAPSTAPTWPSRSRRSSAWSSPVPGRGPPPPWSPPSPEPRPTTSTRP